MAGDFIPKRDADLLHWTANFATKGTAFAAAVGVTLAQMTAYTALQTAFASAYTAAINPDTRSPGNIALKDMARANLVANTRLLAGVIQKHPGTNDAQRVDLGLTVKHVPPTPVPAPATAPKLTIVSVDGRTVRIRLSDAEHPTRRRRPTGTKGATVLSYVGPTMPEDPAVFKFEGNTSKTVVDVTFPVSVASGTRVWLTAFWSNERSESGPACQPVGTWVQFGGDMSMAA